MLRYLCLGLAVAAALVTTGCCHKKGCCAPACVSSAPPCCPSPPCCAPGGPAPGPAPVQAFSAPVAPAPGGCCNGR